MLGYVSEPSIKKNAKDIHKPNVFIPGAGGSGSDSNVLGDTIVAAAGSVCSQTYLYAAFNSAFEAESFAKYVRTRLFRFLVSAIKITQQAQNKVYRYVPIQDFSEKSDIDWSLSITEIDKALYIGNMNFRKKKIEFIESMIKPM